MDPFLGQIIMFAGNFAPRGWALCEGQLLPINQNQALFSILGTTYGGDGRTTFALPELRGRTPISQGDGPGLPSYRLGAKSGQATHVLNTLEMPSHNHTATATAAGTGKIQVSSGGATSGEAVEGTPADAGATSIYNSAAADDEGAGVAITATATATVLNNGGSQGHNNMQPYLAVNYIIALQGVFPSRS